MECSNKDILFQAAEAWMDLTQYRYIFTYGYKNKLYTITLGFTPSDFPHLAGFQYMKDIAAPLFSPNKANKKSPGNASRMNKNFYKIFIDCLLC